MSELHAPIKQDLAPGASPAAVARMWKRIDARTRAREARAPRGRLLFAVVAVVAAAALVIVGSATLERSRTVAVASTQGPLLLANGASLEATQAPERDETLTMKDRSTLTLHRGASLEALDNSGTAVALRQPRGHVSYDITPHGPRRWTIECGVATIEVVGTSFDVDRGASGVRVDVRRGEVLVRTAPDRVTLLTAGMNIDVPVDGAGGPVQGREPRVALLSAGLDAGLHAELAPSPASAVAPSHTLAPGISASADAPMPAKPDATWRRLARAGATSSAYDELGPGGIERASRGAGVDDLLALADVARLSGHPAEAIAPLRRVVELHAKDSRAPLAAFAMGRTQLTALGAPAAAARAFEQAIALGLPAALAEDAYALLIESRAKAGERAGARAAYTQYVSMFPDTAKAKELEVWVRDP